MAKQIGQNINNSQLFAKISYKDIFKSLTTHNITWLSPLYTFINITNELKTY